MSKSGRLSGTQTSRPTLRVGVRVPDWANGFAYRLFEGIVAFRRTGAPIELHFDQPSGADLPTKPIGSDWDGDGLLVFRHTSAEGEAWQQRGMFVVNLSMEYPDIVPRFPRITIDNRIVGRVAAEHLAAMGLRDFAYIHESSRRYSEERRDAFREAIATLGGRFHCIDVPVSQFPKGHRPREIERLVSGRLAGLPRPCGLFAKDDIAAVWTSRFLRNLGIGCPDEMPIIGVDDDIVFCNTMDPPLSSIPYPGSQIGFEAARLLFDLMNGKRIPADHRITVPPAPPVSRESTGHVILADSVVTRALRYLRATLTHRAVGVAELAQQSGVSRESLRQRFHAALGHSAKREIERIRSAHVCERLRSSNSTLETLAEECGFAGADEVCRFVKRTTGKTPGSFREKKP